MLRLPRIAAALLPPFALLALFGAVGCPKDDAATTTSAATSSASVPAPTSAAPLASTSSSTHAPVDDDLAPPTKDDDDHDDAAEGNEKQSSNDALGDAITDSLDGDAIGDASDADARDARPAWDAKDEDAPLMGAKTYADETPERGLRKITSNAAKVHKAPKDGASIASLPRGTDVSLVASIWDWYRVRYVDPNTGVRRQGWVYVINFAGPRRKSCPEGWEWHEQDGGWCDRECTKTTDCKAIAGYKCSGTRCFYATP